MSARRPLFLFLILFAAFLWGFGRTARADRIGRAYRGPTEELHAHGGDDEHEDEGGVPGEEGGGGEGGGGEGGGGEGGGGEGGGGEGGGGEGSGDGGAGSMPGGSGGSRGGGKAAAFDGRRLWNWWWEYNKDRYLARATIPGRIKSGSAYYWFGAGAKYPPRDIDPVSEQTRNTKIFKALRAALNDPDVAVRTEACIALGRLGNVAATKDQEAPGKSNNLVVRALIEALEKPATTKSAQELRYSAILGLGICGDPDGAKYLLRATAGSDVEMAYRYVALGLARHTDAIPFLVQELPKNNRASPSERNLAAIHALGLFGPDIVPVLEEADAIKHLVKLANPRGSQDATIVQAVAALGRLQSSFKTVRGAFGGKSKDVQYTAVLAMANYGNAEGDTPDTKDAAKFLITKAYKAGEGQIKNFSIYAAGDLASRLNPNSPTRQKLLKHLREAVDKKDSYLRACAAVACGVAEDMLAREQIWETLREAKDTHVVAAMCMALGLLRDTDDKTLKQIRDRVMYASRWEADNRGSAALALALAGDTTRIDDLKSFHGKDGLNRLTKRHTPLAIGVLGGKDDVKALIEMFATPFDPSDRYPVANAVYALAWLRDQGQVDKLVTLTQDASPKVRGMSVIALGRVGARDRVDPLTRCFENMSHNNRFRWDILWDIAHIL